MWSGGLTVHDKRRSVDDSPRYSLVAQNGRFPGFDETHRHLESVAL